VHSHRREAFVKIGFYRIVRGWDNPEKPIGRDSGAVVVSLFPGIEKRRVGGIEIVRVELTLVNVKSNEHERPVMVFTVFPYVLALHGAHVSAKRERPRFSIVGEGDTGAGAKTPNHGIDDQAVKVADLRRITLRGVEYREGQGRVIGQRIVVNVEAEGRRTSGDRVGFGSIRVGQRERAKRELRCSCKTCCPRGGTQESTTSEIPGVGVKAAKVLLCLSL
jgi:hypothetical protein